MIQAIKDDYSDAIYQEAIKRFGVEEDQVKALKGFESYVYDCNRKEGDFILKITHTLRRTKDYLLGELEFVNHLVDNGLSTIPRAILSLNEQLIEIIDLPNGHAFLVYAFEKAPGELITKETWTKASFYELGRTTGLMHHLTQSYQPSKKVYYREEWDQEDFFNIDKYCQPENGLLYQNGQSWLTEMKETPKSKSTYGLVHGDLHHGNFFVYKGKIHPFDFDDCGQNYFIADTAITLYYMVGGKLQQKNKTEFYHFFLEHYLKGYETVAHYEEEQLKQIPLLMKLRSLLLYNIFTEVFEWEKLSEKQQKRFALHRHFLEVNKEVVEYDWTIT